MERENKDTSLELIDLPNELMTSQITQLEVELMTSQRAHLGDLPNELKQMIMLQDPEVFHKLMAVSQEFYNLSQDQATRRRYAETFTRHRTTQKDLEVIDEYYHVTPSGTWVGEYSKTVTEGGVVTTKVYGEYQRGIRCGRWNTYSSLEGLPENPPASSLCQVDLYEDGEIKKTWYDFTGEEEIREYYEVSWRPGLAEPPPDLDRNIQIFTSLLDRGYYDMDEEIDKSILAMGVIEDVRHVVDDICICTIFVALDKEKGQTWPTVAVTSTEKIVVCSGQHGWTYLDIDVYPETGKLKSFQTISFYFEEAEGPEVFWDSEGKVSRCCDRFKTVREYPMKIDQRAEQKTFLDTLKLVKNIIKAGYWPYPY